MWIFVKPLPVSLIFLFLQPCVDLVEHALQNRAYAAAVELNQVDQFADLQYFLGIQMDSVIHRASLLSEYNMYYCSLKMCFLQVSACADIFFMISF